MDSTYTEPVAVRPPVAAAMLGISVTRLYELIGDGTLKSRTDGRRRIISVESIKAYNDQQFAKATAGPAQNNEKATAASLASRRLNPPKRRRMQRARQMANSAPEARGNR